MNNKLKSLLEHLIIFCIMGSLYIFVEILYRGRSHWTMWFVGGFAGFIIGELNHEHFEWEMSILKQCIVGAIITTIIEFISGCILNIWLGWNIWDYSNLPLNILGQVCLLFSIFWTLISLPTILLDDWIRWKLFKEPIQKYKWL